MKVAKVQRVESLLRKAQANLKAQVNRRAQVREPQQPRRRAKILKTPIKAKVEKEPRRRKANKTSNLDGTVGLEKHSILDEVAPEYFDD